MESRRQIGQREGRHVAIHIEVGSQLLRHLGENHFADLLKLSETREMEMEMDLHDPAGECL